jgi:hypothetical protein
MRPSAKAAPAGASSRLPTQFDRNTSMQNIRNDDIRSIVDNVITGRISSAEALGAGIPFETGPHLTIAEKLGQLERGGAVELPVNECTVLFNAIEDAVDVLFSGGDATSSHEIVCERLMDRAFALRDPFDWACRLRHAMETGEPLRLDGRIRK